MCGASHCRVNENNQKLAALGLPVPGDKEAQQKRKAAAAKADREAKKYQKTVNNWTALCRVGTRVKVPGDAPRMPSDVPEVRPCPTPPVSFFLLSLLLTYAILCYGSAASGRPRSHTVWTSSTTTG